MRSYKIPKSKKTIYLKPTNGQTMSLVNCDEAKAVIRGLRVLMRGKGEVDVRGRHPHPKALFEKIGKPYRAKFVNVPIEHAVILDVYIRNYTRRRK